MSDNIPANERPKTPDYSSDSPIRTSGAVWGGLILIGLGVVFLMQTLGILPGHFNWWAIFILFPGVTLLYRAYRSSQEGLSHQVRGQLIGGSILTMIAVTFLFNLSWALMGPVFLIMIGVAIFVTSQR